MNSRKMIVLLLIALMTFGAYDVFAGGCGSCSGCGGCEGQETELKVFGSSRYRFNTTGFDFNKDTPLNWYTEMRTRVGIKAKANDRAGAFFQIQDCRTIGVNPGLDFTNNDTQMHQGYLWYKPCDKSWFKAGRMAVGLHNERLIGKVGWHNTGRTFEGLMFGHQLNDNISLAGVAFQADERFDGYVDFEGTDPIADPMFYGINVNFAEQMFDLFLYMLSNPQGAGATDHYKLMTFGAYSNRKFGSDMWYDAMFAMQSGTDTDSSDLSGMLLYAMVGKMFEKFGLYGGVDYTTGDDPDTADKCEEFNNLFYTGHKFRGHMDLFVVQPMAGLMDIFFGGKYTIKDGWKAGGTYHMFKALQDLNAAGDKTYGNEIDIFVKHTAEDFSWQSGYSIFSADSDSGYFGSDPDSQAWWYSMFMVDW